jgi:hypothetical protein
VAPAVGDAGRRITSGGGGRALGAGTEVGGEPTAATDADAGAGVAIEGGRWSRGCTPSGISEEHYWIKQSRPSSFWFPYVRGLRRW